MARRRRRESRSSLWAALRGVPRGWVSLAPLAGLVAWLAFSISWSWLPARSWDYADRALVYLLFAVLGVWLVGSTRALAPGSVCCSAPLRSGRSSARCCRRSTTTARREWRVYAGRSASGTSLRCSATSRCHSRSGGGGSRGRCSRYFWLVALVLTYSRGGLATAAVVARRSSSHRDRWESGATLVAAAMPAAAVVGIAFALPGVTSDGESNANRWRDGLIFGLVLLVGAGAAALLARARRPHDTPALRRALVVVGTLALAGVVAVAVVKAGSFDGGSAVGNGAGRFGSGSSNFRTVWWQQAWDGWQGHKLAGTGGGTFHLTNLRFRGSYLDETTEPHSLPLQFLTETGVVGFALFVAACAFLLRGSWRRQSHELALALVFPAFLIHSLVDVDWDFVAVSVPAFLVAGALVGREPFRRVSPFATLATAGVAALAIGVLVLPWLGNRWATDALVASPARAVTLANRAESVDPLLVEPLWAKAFAPRRPSTSSRSIARRCDGSRRTHRRGCWRVALRSSSAATRPHTPISRGTPSSTTRRSRAPAATSTTPRSKRSTPGRAAAER